MVTTENEREAGARGRCCDGRGGCDGAYTAEDKGSGSQATSYCCAGEAEGSCCEAKQEPCCASSSCHDQGSNVEGPEPLRCIAVVRPDHSAVDVYDSKGRSRTFRPARKTKSGGATTASAGGADAITEVSHKICYSTHGVGNGADGLLSPCFDENGEHGEPEETCFCGIDDPHLHAHVYDPERCGNDDIRNDRKCCDDNACESEGASSGCCQERDSGKIKKEVDISFLAQLTLHPDPDDTDDADSTADDVMLSSSHSVKMPINESLPKQCNGSDIQRQLKQMGMKLTNWGQWKPDSNGQEHQQGSKSYDRLFRVEHEDHTDYLLHDEVTGDLQLQHPCEGCGVNDIHGRFRLLHSRSWMDDGTEAKAAPRRKGSQEIQLSFYQARKEPFKLFDIVKDFTDRHAQFVELETGRTHAARVVINDSFVDAGDGVTPAGVGEEAGGAENRVGKSQLFVEKICCASELPAINAIVGPIDGVVDFKVNTTTKTLYINHDVDVVSADDIVNALNEQRFGAHVRKDAALELAQKAGIPTDCFVESTFKVPGDQVFPSENDADAIRACLAEKVSESYVQSICVAVDKKSLLLEHNPYYLNASSIAEILQKHGHRVEISSDGAADGMWPLSHMKKDETTEDIEHQKSSVRWPVILSGIFWAISMLSFIGGNWAYLKYVALLSVAFGLPAIAQKAYRTLRQCRFDANAMMLFAALGAVALQEYTEAAAVTFLFAISESLETRATARARNALAAIVCLRPERASVINPITKDIVVLPSNAVAVGTLVSVSTGSMIPCDGIVFEGKSTVDESSLTGESRPVHKGIGSAVSGGTLNSGSTRLIVKTTSTSNNSAIARLIRLVEEAQANRSETEKLVDAFAKVYTPIVLLTAVCMCTIPWAFGPETGRFWTHNGLVAIVIACPCALIISTPVTYVAGLAAAAQKGIIVKGGAHLEAMAGTRQISFDKTGTLSEGIFELLHFNGIRTTRSRKEVLAYLALMEAPASHPLSDALVKGAANEQVAVPTKLELKNHSILPGEGITALVQGKQVHVGNEKLFQRLNLFSDLDQVDVDIAEEWANSGGSVGFISIEGEGIVGAYCVADRIRNEAVDVVKSLQRMGIDVTMLTGDQRRAATGIGHQVGLQDEHIKSQLLPEDKLAYISSEVEANKAKKKCWTRKSKVMMVGDGVNDAPALALADVSVAMGEGAALAMETADVTLLDSNLKKLLYIIRMGRRVVRTIIENVTFSLATKAIVMGFAFAGRAGKFLCYFCASSLTTHHTRIACDNINACTKNIELNLFDSFLFTTPSRSLGGYCNRCRFDVNCDSERNETSSFFSQSQAK